MIRRTPGPPVVRLPIVAALDATDQRQAQRRGDGWPRHRARVRGSARRRLRAARQGGAR